jgi:murein DD-endopeptidase MepM/ murein hydrolase activator NlpD
MMPLHGLQLLCCAAVAGIVVHMTAGHTRLADHPAQTALAAFEAASLEMASARTAAEAALAGLTEVKVVVQRNDTLDAIFRRLEVSLADLANIRALELARQKLDRLLPGDELTLATRDGQLVALQRPLSIEQTLKDERDEAAGFVASVEDVPLTRHVRSASGVIESSVFVAAMSAGVADRTTMGLADVFRWDVDFNRMQPGDAFTLVYEQVETADGEVEDRHILAAEVVNGGRSFRAVRYEYADGKFDYYTPEGLSLRKAFLKAPLKFSRISSVYNPRRRHPVLNTIRAHRGVDYAAATGTPVLAVGAGRVQSRGVSGGFGNLIEIAHSGPSKVVTRYAHLSRFAKDVKVGTRVEQGQLIGYVGSTGLATGPHLHFEFLQGGKHVDPQKAISNSEPGPPVPATDRAKFDAQVAPLLARLNAAPAPVSTALATR